MSSWTRIIGDKLENKDNFILPYSLKVYEENIYIIDRLSNGLYKYNFNGIGGRLDIKQIFDGEVKSIELNFPYDVLVDENRIYIADGGNYRILVCNLEGVYLYEFGGYGDGECEFCNGGIFNGDGRSSNPQNIFLDNDGNINAVDIIKNKIKVFNFSGKFLYSYELDGVKGFGTIDVDSDGYMYVADTKDFKVKCYDKYRKLIWEVGGYGSNLVEFNAPWRVVVHGEQIYISDLYNHRIQIFDKFGKYIDSFGEWGIEKNQVNYIFGFDFDQEDNLYITDTWNHRIKIYDKELNVKKIVYKYQEEMLLRPSAVRINEEQTSFWVCDYLNHKLKLYDMDGNYITSLGKLGSEEGCFKYPNDIYISEDGNLFISDSKNNRVQIFDKELRFIKAINFSKFGLFLIPSSVVTHENILFVADINNSCIYKFDLENEKYMGIFMSSGSETGEVFSKYKTEFIRMDISKKFIFIADSSNNRVQKVNIDTGNAEVLNISCKTPTRVRVKDEGLIIVNRGEHSIDVLGRVKLGGTIGNSKDLYLAPWDADYSEKNKRLIIADSLNNRIKIIQL